MNATTAVQSPSPSHPLKTNENGHADRIRETPTGAAARNLCLPTPLASYYQRRWLR
jgi:hypothetical protein